MNPVILTEPIMAPVINFTNFFLGEPVFKIGSLNLFGTETMFRFRKILKFRVLRSQI